MIKPQSKKVEPKKKKLVKKNTLVKTTPVATETPVPVATKEPKKTPSTTETPAPVATKEPKKTPSTTETPEPVATKEPKKTAETPVTTETVSTKEHKKTTATKEPKKVRTVNTKQLNSEKTGLNISPAKIKNLISNNIINKDIYSAISELNMLESSNKTVDDISDSTKQVLNDIINEDKCHKKHQYVRKKYESLSEDEKLSYNKIKNSESGTYNKCVFVSQPTDDFNLKFDTNFYKGFSYDMSSFQNISDVIKLMTKKKYRFSNNSRLYISAFVELLIQQLAHNSIYTCVENKKKIVQVEYNKEPNSNLDSGDYSLYNIVSNLEVYKLYKDLTVNHDEFVINNLTKEKQYQFKYYVSEICREVKQTLTLKYNDSSNVYNSTSISKQFKNYCSLIVCEVLNIIGKMIKVEVESRSVKTINDTVVKTVLEQLHAANGIDFTKTSEFISNTYKKFNMYKHTKKVEKSNKLDTVDTTP